MNIINLFKNEEKENGKKFLLITGTHGNEITPLDVGMKLIKDKDQYFKYIDDLNQVDLLQGLNIKSIEEGTRNLPNFHLNRDGNRINLKDIYETDKLKKEEKIVNLCLKYDYIIDIHSSPEIKNCFLLDSDFNYKDHILEIFKTNRKILFVERDFDGASLKRFINNIKQEDLDEDQKLPIAFTYEASGLEKIDEASSSKTRDDLFLFIQVMSKQKDLKPNEKIKKSGYFFSIKAPLSGIYYPKYHQRSNSQFIYGKIEDINCEKEYEIKLPNFLKDLDYLVLCEHNKSYVNAGDELLTIYIKD